MIHRNLLNSLIDESLKQISQNCAPAEGYPVPTSAQFIADSYHQASNAFVQALKTQRTDHTPQERIYFIGQPLPDGSLMFLI